MDTSSKRESEEATELPSPQGESTRGAGQDEPPTLPRGRRRPRPRSLTQPNTPDSVREQIAWEAENVLYRASRHDELASRWDAVASWTRVVVTLTSGVSALSIVADNIVLATTFAIVTAAVAALNAGFSPPEAAKKHRDAARAYGHLERPLGELLFKIDSYNEMEYVPETGYGETSDRYYDAGYYRIKGSNLSDADLRDIWEAFTTERERIENIDEAAPSLIGVWPSRSGKYGESSYSLE